MTKTTVPFEASEIVTDYFKIHSIETFETTQKYYETETLCSWMKKLAEKVDGKYSKKADLSVYYRFGKKKIESNYEVYFNDVEDVITSLRLYYAGKIEWLSKSNLAYFSCQDDF